MEIRSSGSTRRGTLLVRTCLLGLAAQIAMPPIAAAQSNQAMTSQMLQLMDRQKEIALALSACPASVADKAAVYVPRELGVRQSPRKPERFHRNRPACSADQPGPAVHGS
jgi:hypothetical protein